MTNAASNQQIDPCEWCKRAPETSAVPGSNVTAVRCGNRSCPVYRAEWMSLESWTRSRVSDGGVAATDRIWVIGQVAFKHSRNGGVEYVRVAPRPEQETFGDGHYCTHHPDDPAHTKDCYDYEKFFATASPAAPKEEELSALTDKVNANVARMDASQKVDAAMMSLEFNPATTPSPDAAREAAREIGENFLEGATPMELNDIETIIRKHCFLTGGESRKEIE